MNTKQYGPIVIHKVIEDLEGNETTISFMRGYKLL